VPQSNDKKTLLQIATAALLAALSAVCAYPYPGYSAGGLEGHGLGLEGHGLGLEGHGLEFAGAGGLEGHAIGSYGGHGGETAHDGHYYVSVFVRFDF
jgi:hypothetical protein